MRALIQRVTQASVSIDNNTISEIKHGLLILVCAMNDDNEEDAEKMASKISKIRIFNDLVRLFCLYAARQNGHIITIHNPA